ncbi:MULTISPECIES: DUF488 family protein [unclassified Cobetia]|uniref:DUF488 domain-containing protein n=1 Tax=unclassified Cobetia TaxID=2609414 RepID=UPI0020977343|nr:MULTISPECIES: DUF488 domain-containing protein [unclassified Cobetia]MCO7231365.1 DUF488 domain-containing protein [Cobetia sp. Dlab-2-AX]MCO7234226.1 DUF488 domain-containing protein [Cobetia sp. Dlab-2-U]
MNNDQVCSVYSIGHGSRSINEFLKLIVKYKIQYVVDVRTKPGSKYHPQFNMESLRSSLKAEGVGYVFMGDTLGGLPKDDQCYTKLGYVDYTILANKIFFRNGLSRLVSANDQKINIACMCSELDPCDCHRSKLIGSELYHIGLEMNHIDARGELIAQAKVMNDIVNKNGNDLFLGDSPIKYSAKSYR